MARTSGSSPITAVENLVRRATDRLERGDVAAQNRLQVLVNGAPPPEQMRRCGLRPHLANKPRSISAVHRRAGVTRIVWPFSMVLGYGLTGSGLMSRTTCPYLSPLPAQYAIVRAQSRRPPETHQGGGSS